MKVLFLAHRIPFPPNKGDKVRAWHELVALARAGHEVHLIAFADEAGDLQYRDAFDGVCRSAEVFGFDRTAGLARAIARLPFGQPLSFAYFNLAAMRRRVEEAIERLAPDVLVVYSAAMWQYVPAAWWGRTVVDLVDADSEKWRDYARHGAWPMAWVWALEARRVAHAETVILHRAGRTLVVTRREAASLMAHAGRLAAPPQAIVNGVALDRFGGEAPPVPDAERAFLAQPAVRLLFTGAMNYRANVDGAEFFAREVLPLVRASEPRAEFLVVGARPVRRVRRLASLPGVTVTGRVADVRPYLAAATACVVPLRIARGVQNKVLEAMAARRAVVCTSVSVAGLELTPGRHLLVADTPGAMAAAIVSVIRDASLRERLGADARAFVEARHDWDARMVAFTRLVEEAAATAHAVETREPPSPVPAPSPA